MKLQLNKQWFEKRIRPGEDFEVGAGVPLDAAACGDKSSDCGEEESIDEEFVATRVLGRLIELMQRDRRLSV